MSDLSVPDALARIDALVGPKGVITDPDAMAPYLVEWRGRFCGRAPMVVRPATTEEVAAVIGLCHQAQIPVVPQGGNTGLVGGSVPFEHGRELVLSLGRLTRIRALDPDDHTITVEAGCVLETARRAAEDGDRWLPLSFGAEGTCQIGGCLSTNAGGMLTVRYGNARDLVLGLEVVLPDGRIWSGLNRLRKDNTGYDLKQLFLGAEGTLGVITAAVLKLVPRPKQIESVFAGLPDPTAAVRLLGRLRAATGDAVIVFELIPRLGLEFACRHVPDVTDPLAAAHPWYCLIECASCGTDGGLREVIETCLGENFEDGTITDAAVAASGSQAAALRRLREAVVEGQGPEGGSIKNDVSVPVARVPDLIARASAAVAERVPGIRPVPFGHVGDGNIHFNLSQPVGADRAGFLGRWDELQAVVNDVALALGGSISAEHGIGRFKVEELERVKDPVSLDLMRRIKHAIDPEGIMNPGKVLRA